MKKLLVICSEVKIGCARADVARRAYIARGDSLRLLAVRREYLAHLYKENRHIEKGMAPCCRLLSISPKTSYGINIK